MKAEVVCNKTEMARRFRLLLAEKNYSLSSVAINTGLAVPVLSKIANDGYESEPRLKTLVILANYFNVQLRWLMGLEGKIEDVIENR